MIDSPYPKLIKGGFVIYFFISLITGILSGVVTFTKTGDLMPLADNTLGLLLASDNNAYQLEQDLSSGKFDNLDQSYQTIIKNAVIREIITNIIIQFVIIYGLHKIIHKLLEWSDPQGTKFQILSLFLALLTFMAVSLAYHIFKVATDTEIGNLKLMETLLSALPFKSIAYGGKLLITAL